MIPRHLQIGVGVMLAVALAMGFYVGRMRGKARRVEAAIGGSEIVGPPPAGLTEQVTLYVAYDDVGVLHPTATKIPLPADREQRAQELLRALLAVYEAKPSPHPLAPGSEVRDVYLVDPGLAVIDLNAAFADGHRSGVLVEELTVASLIETLSANIPGILRVKILVDGKERDTLAGHADLSAIYDVAAVTQMAGGLQN